LEIAPPKENHSQPDTPKKRGLIHILKGNDVFQGPSFFWCIYIYINVEISRGLVDFFEWKSIPESHWGAPCMVYYTYICHKYQPNVGKYTIHPMDIPWASTTIKIMVDPISMIKTLREAMEVISTLIVLMVVEILEFLFQGFLAESVYDFI